MDQLKKAVGLSTSGKNDSYTDIDYTLYHRAEGDLYIYENGVYRGIFGTYETGDELSVERLADGTIQYVHNGTVIYTSMQIITVDIPFVADASIYSSLGSTTLEVEIGRAHV